MLYFPNQYQLSQDCRQCKDTGRSRRARAPDVACVATRAPATPVDIELETPPVEGGPSGVPDKALCIVNTSMSIFHTLLAVTTYVVGDPNLTLQVWGTSLALNQDPEIDSFLSLEARPVGELPYTGIVILFFALSAVFHFGNAWLWNRYSLSRLEDKHAPTRWMEYFFSASVMILCVAYPAGLQQGMEMFFCFMLIATTMLFGDLTERMNKPKPDEDAWALPLPARLIPHLQGYVPQMAAWIGIFVRFYAGTDGEDNPGPPPFVYALVWTQAVLFFSFGFVQLVVLLRPPSKYVQGEFAYQVLSLVAKGALGGILLVNVLFLSSFECIFDEVAENNSNCTAD